MPTVQQTQSMVQYLSTYCFEKVYNSVNEEYRVNVALNPVAARLQTSRIVLAQTTLPCPLSGYSFMAYGSAFSILDGAITLPQGVWVNALTLLTTQQVRLSVYDNGGCRVPLISIWLFKIPYDDQVLVAVEQSALIQCLSKGLSSTLWMTTFKASQLPEPLTGYSVKITTAAQLSQMQSLLGTLQTGSAAVFATINGYAYSQNNIPELALNQFVDLIVDPNVIAQFTVTVNDSVTGYQSNLYSGYREVIHCPKALNPNNLLLTHDRATLFVRDVATNRSVYLHRVSPVSVQQITHNDLSVDRSVLNGFQAYLNSTDIVVDVVYRKEAQPRSLITDRYGIQDLYLCNDATIISLLTGQSDQTMSFWQASQLEASPYLNLMFNDPQTINPSAMDQFVNGLGYFTVGAILAQNVYTGTYQGTMMYTEKPYVLQNNNGTALVYANNVKVNQSLVSTLSASSAQFVISISSNLPSNTPVEVVYLEAGLANPTRFIGSTTTYEIAVSGPGVRVYQEVPITQVVGYKTGSSLSYQLLSPGANTYGIFQSSNGSWSLTVYPTLYGAPILIVPESFCWSANINIDTLIASNEPIIVSITTTDNTNVVMPVLGWASSEVYINGLKLIEGIDYVLAPLLVNGAVALTDVVICNQTYLNLSKTGNQVEVYLHTGVTIDRDLGYVMNDIVLRTNRPSLWYPQIGRAMAEGVLVSPVIDNGIWIASPSPIANGSVFELLTQYPAVVNDALSNYSSVQDTQIVNAIDVYLNRTLPTPPTVLPITQEHTIYSPYLTAIINDIVNNNIIVVNDPSNQNFLAQFSAYQYLYQRDLTLSNNNAINRSFIAVSTSYAQMPATSAANTVIIQRLINLTLVQSGQTIGSVFV